MADPGINSTDYQSLLKSIRSHHGSLDPQDTRWRKEQLQSLNLMLKDNEKTISEALHKDLGKGLSESYLTEIGFVQNEIKHALKNIDNWAKPQKVKTPLAFKPGHSEIIPEPLGVSLIIGAWNYPINLTLSPLVACIAAGNAAIIKPSEISSATSKVLSELIPKYLDDKAYKVVEGGPIDTQAVLKERFDKIFFTGSHRIGSIVMKAAAEHVTPVTLELGGKSPCIVDKNVDIKLVSERIVQGKFTNAGQTCVAPDYILAHKDIIEPLTKAFQRSIKKFYGADPSQSKDYARIINKTHFKRLASLLNNQNIAEGGISDEKSLYIAPTLISNVSPNDNIMGDEIFGPILPIISIDNIDKAFNFVALKPKPLALYLFSKNNETLTKGKTLSAGGICMNDTIVHLGNPNLPFGGVGQSGFGKYHGKAGFDSFSNLKPVFHASSKNNIAVRYPPYNKVKQFIIKRILRM
jgi:aldehyde dehydrogenase (NAD+)